MCRAEGMAIAPWGVIGQGKIRTDEEEKRRGESGEKGRTVLDPNWERSPLEVKVSHKLEEIAKEVGAKHITAVAIAYVMHVRIPPVKSILNHLPLEWFHRKLPMCFLLLEDER